MLRKLLIKILHAKPTMYSGSLVLNLVGMQWIRILFFYLHRVLRSKKPVSLKYIGYVKELEEKGFVVIPNFLSNENHVRFKKEYDSLVPFFENDSAEILLPHVDRLSLHSNRISDFTKNLFLKNELMESVATAFLNRKYHLDIKGYLTRIYINQAELDQPKNGGTNNLHFDAPLRVLKFFYYLSDTDENNAAFNYCPNTHKRNSLSRLWFEYILSIRYVLNKWKDDSKGEYMNGEPWVTITKREMEKHNLKIMPIRGKANTLVIANTGGFHKRGAFLRPGVRETVEINYRDVETLRNDLYPLEKKLRDLYSKKEAPSTAPKTA